jgi:hypothetical protein
MLTGEAVRIVLCNQLLLMSYIYQQALTSLIHALWMASFPFLPQYPLPLLMFLSCADPIRWVVSPVDDIDLSNSRRIGYDLYAWSCECWFQTLLICRR